jgi:hypothetical protein
MNAVQIAGCSGAGKSAVAAVLARLGLVSIDADDDPLLARFVDPAGAVVAEQPTAPDLAWLARRGYHDLGPYRGHSRVPAPQAAGIAGPLARIGCDPH